MFRPIKAITLVIGIMVAGSAMAMPRFVSPLATSTVSEQVIVVKNGPKNRVMRSNPGRHLGWTQGRHRGWERSRSRRR